MQIDKQLLDTEILNVEAQLTRTRAQLAFAEGALSTLRQLRKLLEPKPEPETESCPKETPTPT